ncbi:hypothetical protein HPB47_010694, partial [Ixodes persulcatus]
MDVEPLKSDEQTGVQTAVSGAGPPRTAASAPFPSQREMQGDDKRNDLFLGTGGWDARPAPETREGPPPSWGSPACRNSQEGSGEESWGESGVPSVIHRSGSAGNSQGAPRQRGPPSSSCWVINQESAWDTPPSPQPGTKEPPPVAPCPPGVVPGAPQWKANTGTEIWESSVRSSRGGPKQPPPAPTSQGQQAATQPWGPHTPTSHIGGTWGEDDESPGNNNNGNGNMWTGVPRTPQAPEPPAPSWGDNGNNRLEKQWGGPSPSWGGPDPEGGRPWGGGNRHGADEGSWGGPGGPKGVGTWSPVGPPPPNPGKRGGEPSGWEEPSPPPCRRPPVTHYDDGTAVWGNPTRQGKVSHWKDMPSVKPISGAPPGMLRVPKDGVWGGPKGRPWPDWDEHKGAWDQGYWGAKPKGPPSWAEGQIDTSTWGGPSKQGGKPLTKDLIYASKQFRLLSEMGFKKEDVENALRMNCMNLEDTLMDLQAMARAGGVPDSGLLDGSDCGGRGGPKMRGDDGGPDPHGPHGEPPFPGFHGGSGFQGLPVFGAGYGAAQGQGFKPPPVKGSNQGGLLNSGGLGGQNSSLTVGNSISSLSPALVQKILQQQHFPPQGGGGGAMGTRLPNVPSAAQLRLLVQQIQMAVHAGHLNPQILNQPLAPQTLQLLYQLLQQIKVLHALQQQQQVLHAKGPPGQPPPLQLNVQLTQTKQRILNLQNQIAAQQALFLKQQLPAPPQQQEPFPKQEPLHADFRDLNLKEAASQSRLTQWKLPASLDQEDKPPQQNGAPGGGDFSRAPGPSKGALHPLLGPPDGPWAQGGGGGAPRGQDGWPESSRPSNSPPEAKEASSAYSLGDLVAEFEPGKPWKGASSMKSAEDDPHLTPGSVVRSPLSLNTIKDSELFGGGWKQSPPATEGSLAASLASLTSSTWAFTPAMHTGSSSAKGNKGGSWGSMGSEQQMPSSDPWGAPKTRGPPPGLSSSGTQGWDQSSCTFLVLKNLTPQIDGSTLKTLCMQHGPLQLFHLFLKHGLALAQYSSREEAAKAQSALHNCILSNTTMLAYIPSEAEVAQFLQLAQGTQQGPPCWAPGGGGGGPSFHRFPYGSRPKAPEAPWNPASTAAPPTSSSSGASHLWSFPGAGGGLWAAPQAPQGPQGGDDHPGGQQSSLNSFLPGDLLSGESMLKNALNDAQHQVDEARRATEEACEMCQLLLSQTEAPSGLDEPRSNGHQALLHEAQEKMTKELGRAESILARAQGLRQRSF